MCLLHYTARVEEACDTMRRETASGPVSAARRGEIESYIAAHGERLFRAVTGGVSVPDEHKRRVLNIFLILMNLRESMDRAGKRAAANTGKKAVDA